jgi:hypothetical protein
MDSQIALLLGQDGIVNGAVYGLMALALVLVFSVTRVIFIPAGRVRRLRRALDGHAAGRPRAGHAVAAAGAGR